MTEKVLGPLVLCGAGRTWVLTVSWYPVGWATMMTRFVPWITLWTDVSGEGRMVCSATQLEMIGRTRVPTVALARSRGNRPGCPARPRAHSGPTGLVLTEVNPAARHLCAKRVDRRSQPSAPARFEGSCERRTAARCPGFRFSGSAVASRHLMIMMILRQYGLRVFKMLQSEGINWTGYEL